MCAETKHDQVSIQAIQAMSNVGIISRLRLLKANVIHDLVFSFPRCLVARENDSHILPQGICGDFHTYEILELIVKTTHEPEQKIKEGLEEF